MYRLLMLLVWFQGSGKVIEQPRNVPDFTAVHVSAGIQARVSEGPRSVIVHGDDNVVALVRTEVKGSQLEIGWQPHMGDINSKTPIEVIVRAPKIDELGASGGAGIDAGSLGAKDTFRIQASGGGHIKVAANAKQLDAQGSGGAVLTVEGRIDQMNVHVSGGSVLKGNHLQAGALELHGSGGADVRVEVDGNVRGSLSGGSTARVGPRAKVDVQTSGAAPKSCVDLPLGRPMMGRLGGGPGRAARCAGRRGALAGIHCRAVACADAG